MSFTSGQYAAQAQRVLCDALLDIPLNTNKAYKPKETEFLQFARTVFSDHPIPDIVTEEKVFAFLYYQAYRRPKKRGRSKRGQNRNVFDLAEYNNVMEMSRDEQ